MELIPRHGEDFFGAWGFIRFALRHWNVAEIIVDAPHRPKSSIRCSISLAFMEREGQSKLIGIQNFTEFHTRSSRRQYREARRDASMDASSVLPGFSPCSGPLSPAASRRWCARKRDPEPVRRCLPSARNNPGYY